MAGRGREGPAMDGLLLLLFLDLTAEASEVARAARKSWSAPKSSSSIFASFKGLAGWEDHGKYAHRPAWLDTKYLGTCYAKRARWFVLGTCPIGKVAIPGMYDVDAITFNTAETPTGYYLLSSYQVSGIRRSA